MGCKAYNALSSQVCAVFQESPEAEQMDKNDPNYDSGEEKRALAFHSRKVEQVKAYKQAVIADSVCIHVMYLYTARI